MAEVAALLVVRRAGHGHHVSDHHRDHPERRAAASARHRDRHVELLSPARRRHRGRGVRRDRARRHGRARRRGAGAALRRRRRGADFADLFRWVFIAAASFLAAAFVAVLCIAERPLRGPAVRPQPAPRRRTGEPRRLMQHLSQAIEIRGDAARSCGRPSQPNRNADDAPSRKPMTLRTQSARRMPPALRPGTRR